MTPSPKSQAPVLRLPQGRFKSNTPPIVPGHHQQQAYYNGRRSGAAPVAAAADNSVKEKPKEIDYFAGAKFDCLPSVSSLPTPPAEWTIPVLRSQSQPSSPVTTSNGGSGVRIDVSSLFLTPQANKVSSYHDQPTNNHYLRSKQQNYNNNKTKKTMHEEIDTQKAKTVHEKKVTATAMQRKKQDDNFKNGRGKQNKYSKQQPQQDKPAAAAYPAFESSSPKAESKPIDIATPMRTGGHYQHKQMYPHLTESLKCLLKVQG